jgi:cytochrome c oxidase assembly protein subunit 15
MSTSPSRAVALWLLAGCLLIAAMVTIGGVTRLTGSGLSITEWNVIMGALPPRTEADWGELFRKYQAIPQYQLVNPHFTLEDFKSIFWWEYVHRLVGRGIGLVFLVPFVIFLAKGWLDRPLLRKVLLIFGLGALQGALGWFMVASGLSERTSVSHYRLAAHLVTALLTLAVTLWVALDLLQPDRPARPVPPAIRSQVRLFTFLLTVQIGYGALVAGLKAGFAYNTFPLMGGRVIPAGAWQLTPGWSNLLENPATVQFVHRTLAWTLAVLGVWLWHTLRVHGVRRQANLLLGALGVQLGLGILTILHLPRQPVVWGASHQAGAVALLVAAVLVLHTVTRDVPRSTPS